MATVLSYFYKKAMIDLIILGAWENLQERPCLGLIMH